MKIPEAQTEQPQPKIVFVRPSLKAYKMQTQMQ